MASLTSNPQYQNPRSIPLPAAPAKAKGRRWSITGRFFDKRRNSDATANAPLPQPQSNNSSARGSYNGYSVPPPSLSAVQATAVQQQQLHKQLQLQQQQQQQQKQQQSPATMGHPLSVPPPSHQLPPVMEIPQPTFAHNVPSLKASTNNNSNNSNNSNNNNIHHQESLPPTLNQNYLEPVRSNNSSSNGSSSRRASLADLPKFLSFPMFRRASIDVGGSNGQETTKQQQRQQQQHQQQQLSQQRLSASQPTLGTVSLSGINSNNSSTTNVADLAALQQQQQQQPGQPLVSMAVPKAPPKDAWSRMHCPPPKSILKRPKTTTANNSTNGYNNNNSNSGSATTASKAVVASVVAPTATAVALPISEFLDPNSGHGGAKSDYNGGHGLGIDTSGSDMTVEQVTKALSDRHLTDPGAHKHADLVTRSPIPVHQHLNGNHHGSGGQQQQLQVSAQQQQQKEYPVSLTRSSSASEGFPSNSWSTGKPNEQGSGGWPLAPHPLSSNDTGSDTSSLLAPSMNSSTASAIPIAGAITGDSPSSSMQQLSISGQHHESAGNLHTTDDMHTPTKVPKSRRSVEFLDTFEIIPAHRKSDYNRQSDKYATFRVLTPDLKSEIRDELNMYKMKEMAVHVESMGNTAFH